MAVHNTAIVADGAELGEDVEIGPYCVVGASVRLGNGCRLLSHVVIEGNTWLGDECTVFPQAVLGTKPQDKRLPPGEPHAEPQSLLRIGHRNQIRECVTIQGGTRFGEGTTAIGDDNMFLAGCHVGHDAVVGNDVLFTNGAMAAGHTLVEDHAVLGAMVGVHQFARVGRHTMVGAGSMLSKDAPPFSLVQGDRARLVGVNVVGMQRAGFGADMVEILKHAYRMLFWRAGRIQDRVATVATLAREHDEIRLITEFISASRRGVVMPRRRGLREEHPLAER